MLGGGMFAGGGSATGGAIGVPVPALHGGSLERFWKLSSSWVPSNHSGLAPASRNAMPINASLALPLKVTSNGVLDSHVKHRSAIELVYRSTWTSCVGSVPIWTRTWCWPAGKLRLPVL